MTDTAHTIYASHVKQLNGVIAERDAWPPRWPPKPNRSPAWVSAMRCTQSPMCSF